MPHGWEEGGSAGSYGEYMKSRAEGAGSGRSHLERLIAAAAEDAAKALAESKAENEVENEVQNEVQNEVENELQTDFEEEAAGAASKADEEDEASEQQVSAARNAEEVAEAAAADAAADAAVVAEKVPSPLSAARPRAPQSPPRPPSAPRLNGERTTQRAVRTIAAAANEPAIVRIPPKRVALIGDAFVDFNLSGLQRLPAWGTDVPCAGVRMLPGGSCANTARQLGSLGGSSVAVSFFGAVGDDDLGRFFIRALSEEGHVVGAESTLHRLAGVPQSCCTILAGPNDRAMISCYTSNERLTIEPFAATLAPSSDGDDPEPWALFHLGGYFNTVSVHTEATLDALRAMKARGTILTMDPQHDANEKWTGEDGHLARLFPLLDVFLPNEVEIAHVAAHCADQEAAVLAASALQTAVAQRRIAEAALEKARAAKALEEQDGDGDEGAAVSGGGGDAAKANDQAKASIDRWPERSIAVKANAESLMAGAGSGFVFPSASAVVSAVAGSVASGSAVASSSAAAVDVSDQSLEETRPRAQAAESGQIVPTSGNTPTAIAAAAEEEPVSESAVSESRQLPTPEEALEALASKYPHLLIVLTLGAAGVKAARGAARWHVPATKVAFVDATGAGDACAAGFLVTYLQDQTDVAAALRAGVVAGGLSVGVAGACEVPITQQAMQAALAVAQKQWLW